MKVAVVGESRVAAALSALLGDDAGREGDLRLALRVDRTTADHVEQAVGEGGAAVLDLPAGESREFVRSLGARGLRVVDLGPDLRVPQVQCGFPEPFARGRRLVALPSAAAMAAYAAANPLIDAGLLYPDRIAVYAIGGGGPAASLSSPAAEVAGELSWMLEQRGAPMARRVGVAVRGGAGLLVLVQGELGSEAAQDRRLLLKALEGGPGWLRVCPENTYPDAARVAGTGDAEVSAAVDGFAEWVLCSCAVDPVHFAAHAALRALRAMSLESQ